MKCKRAVNLFVILIISTMLSCFSFNVLAKDGTVTVTIPDYQIIIDDASVYYADSIYPFLNYKGITYLPMTYEYSRAMNLTTGWLEGTAFMVAYQPSWESLPVYETTVNKKYDTAIVPNGYNIYINAKKVDNSTVEYPLLNFKGVTYFPLTWEYAVEEFGWKINFENNILKIDTENNTEYRWTLVEKHDNDAVLELYYSKDIPLEDGSTQHDYLKEWYSLDYYIGELTQLTDYTLNEVNNTNTKVDVMVDDGYVYYNEQKLDDIYIEEASNRYIKPEGVTESGYTISAWLSGKDIPLRVVYVSYNAYNYGENGSFGRKREYTFIENNGKLISIGPNTTVENVYELNGDIYFNTVKYGQTTFRHYMKNKWLWKLSDEGQLDVIVYGDYNSMEIIGKANNKLYLKCLWSPENVMEDAPYQVSLVNDGYYTFDGEGIRFITPYIYSDFDIVSDNGDIFAVNNILDKIIKCQINPEYY